ncbi:MAG: enoyl-CoA hydratase-related protein [Candidatus Binatia bacterium]
MSEPALLYEKKDGVATLTMNRPEARNALNPEMMVRLADAWQDVNDDPSVRVAILTGAGEQAFCAGADLEQLIGMAQGRRQPETEFEKRLTADPMLNFKALLRNYQVDKPILSAIKGYCVAGGTELIQVTDIRIASDDAEFGLAEVKRGLFPVGGSTVRLPRQIPFTMAMYILLTGERISAAEALRVGLVTKVVAKAEVLAETRRIAAIICDNGPLAVRAIKQSVLAGLGLPIEQALEKELELGIPVQMTEDAREGSRAFKEKRKPVYKGR